MHLVEEKRDWRRPEDQTYNFKSCAGLSYQRAKILNPNAVQLPAPPYVSSHVHLSQESCINAKRLQAEYQAGEVLEMKSEEFMRIEICTSVRERVYFICT